LSTLPSADHYFLIHQRHKYGRAQWDPAPFHDPLVEFRGALADLLLGAHILHAFGQSLDLFAQL